MLSVLQFSIFLVSSFIEDFFHLFISFFYFISTEKWNRKGKYPNGVKIFTFLLEHRFVWRQIFQNTFQMVIWSENVFKENLML